MSFSQKHGDKVVDYKTLHSTVAESLVRFLSGFLSEGETMLGPSFHGKEVKSEKSKMRGSLVCIA